MVAGITPTPLGEGKSTTTIGLVQAIGSQLRYTLQLNRLLALSFCRGIYSGQPDIVMQIIVR